MVIAGAAAALRSTFAASLPASRRHAGEGDAANRTNNLFMAAVSHNLRAPMTAALGWAER